MGTANSNNNNDDLAYDSNTFKSYKKHKEYRKKLSDNAVGNGPDNEYVEEKYFNCLYCNKINRIEDIVNETSENRTMRTRYMTWKKFKDISNEIGGSLENGMNYLISLHERMKNTKYREDQSYDINIAGGAEDTEKEKMIEENLKRLGIKRKEPT